MSSHRYYLDHAATTPLAPEVAQAMKPWLERSYGNPSSLHREGRESKAALDEARERLSQALGCEFAEVIFASGGTEAAHLALVGLALGHAGERRRILMSAAEHHCVLHQAGLLGRLGFRVELIPVGRDAQIDLAALRDLMADDVLAVSVMAANNELGTLNPIHEVVTMAARVGAKVHCDAVQVFLRPELPHRLSELGVDLLTVSAHKVNGPKGVGAVAYRAGTTLKPLIAGGGQERELRAGTENVAAIVGFGVATTLPRNPGGGQSARDAFEASLPEVTWSVSDAPRLAGHAHGRVPGIDAETLLIRLDREGIAASSGAACSSGSIEPSHVLLACGYSEGEAKQGLRFTFGADHTAEDGIAAAHRVRQAIAGIRSARG